MKSSLFSGLRDECSRFSGVKDGLLHRMIVIDMYIIHIDGDIMNRVENS